MERETYSIHLRLPEKLFGFISKKSKEMGVAKNALILQTLWEMKKIEEQKNR